MLLIALFTVYRGNVVFDRVVTVMFINLLLTVGLQIFMGNSGLGSFGQYAFVTIGAYASIWFSLTPQQKALAAHRRPEAFHDPEHNAQDTEGNDQHQDAFHAANQEHS